MTNDEFITYCFDGNVNKVKKGLRDPNVDPSYKFSLSIRTAVLNNNTEIFKLLLDDGRVDLSVKTYIVLLRAIQHDNSDAIKLLLEKDDVIRFVFTCLKKEFFIYLMPYLIEKYNKSIYELLEMRKIM